MTVPSDPEGLPWDYLFSCEEDGAALIAILGALGLPLTHGENSNP